MDDLISRQAAIDGKICIQRANGVEIYDDYVVPVEYLEQLPSAQPAIVPCDYAKACNKVAMNRITSAVVYMEILEDFKEYGYVLVDMSENMPLDNNSEIPNSSDTISRQAAIDRLTEYGNGRAVFISVGEAIIRIEQLPPAQPERIKGHWIKISPANVYECSECGKNVMTNDICAYDFCHGCGAEMEATE